MLPWADMLRAALTVGIDPQAFWTLSLKEWRWMARGAARSAMSRAELMALDKVLERSASRQGADDGHGV